MRTLDRKAEEIVARIAGTQHGVVARVQLLAAGIAASWIARRLEAGSLIKVHPGVYRVGHAAQSTLATYMAAVLACGDGALLRHRAAAHLHQLLKRPPELPEVLTQIERRILRIRTKRCRRPIDPRDQTVVRGIPVTTVAFTIVDLAATLNAKELAKACHEAGVRYRTTPRQVEECLARHPNAKGAAKLRSVLTGETKVALSGLEERFLSLLAKNGLPLPITNKPAGGRRVDCRWPDRKLTVELDSYTFHSSRHAWEQDRRRERQAYQRGDEFRRFTRGDVFERPVPILRELEQLLG
ncbi:MAG: type IV toxin-antitoxin system AbiEi family antitoxin domain-containing protein [Solirubrobacterales bacterium]